MRRISCIVLCSLIGPASGEEALTLKSTLETGWTSNATETVEGEADRFTQQNHELLLSGTLGTMSLRGTLVFEQTSFAQTVTENDTSIAGGVEVGLALGEDVVLRAGYAVTRDWTGEGLFVAGRQIGVASETLTHEALLELTIAGVDQQAIVSVNGSWRYPGDATISGLPIVIPPCSSIRRWPVSAWQWTGKRR